MAESTGAMTELNRLLQCAVCMNQVTNHRVLHCQHLFCEECLLPLVSDGNSPSSITCPLCRKVCILDDGLVCNLPKSPLVSSLLEKSCQACKRQDRAVLCAHCDKWVCTDCQVDCRLDVGLKSQEMCKKSEDVLRIHRDMLQRIQHMTVEANKQVFTAVGKIDSNADALIGAIKKRQKDLKQQLQQIGANEMTRLEELYGDAYEQTRSLSQCIEDNRQLTHDENLGKYLESYHDMERVYSGICKRSTDIEANKIKVSFDNSLNNDLAEFGIVLMQKKFSIKNIDYEAKTTPQNIFSSKGSRPGELDLPTHVAICPMTEVVVICDQANNRVQTFNNNGQFIQEFGSPGEEAGQFNFGLSADAGGLAITKEGKIVVADTNNDRVQIFSRHGTFVRSMGEHGSVPGQFDGPCGICTDDAGNILVCDAMNQRIQVLKPNGTFLRQFAPSNITPDDNWLPSAIDITDDKIVVTDSNGRLEIFTNDGDHVVELSDRLSALVQLVTPGDVAVDLSGNIIVTDSGTPAVHVLSPQTGQLIHTWESAQLSGPAGVTCTPSGQVIVVDRDSCTVLVY